MAAKKRTVNLDDEGAAAPQSTAVPSRPPLKKRFISNVNIQQQRTANTSTQNTSTVAAAVVPTTTTPTITPTTTTPTITPTTTAIAIEKPIEVQQQQQNPIVATSVSTQSETSMIKEQVTTKRHTPPPSAPDVAQNQPSEIIPQEAEASTSKSSQSVSKELEINFDTDSKPTLLKQMRLAKEQVSENEKRLESLEEHCLGQETKQTLYKIHLKLIQAQAGFMISEGDMELMSPDRINLEDQRDIHDSCLKAIDRLSGWHHHVTQVEERYRQETDPVAKRAIVSDFVKGEMDELARAYHQGQRFMENMRKQLDSIHSNTRSIMNTVHDAQTEWKHATEQLKELTSEWRTEAKRRDRAESKLVAQIEHGGLGDKVPAEPMEVDSKNETPEHPKSPENKEEPALVTESDSKNKLSELNVILTARENEIEILKRDRQSLEHEEERLMSLFSQLSDERLVETDYVKSLKLSIDHYRDRYQDLEMLRSTAKRELDRVLEARSMVEEQIRTEQLSQVNAIGLEATKLEEDLARVGAQRDTLQRQMAKQKSDEAALKKKQGDIILLAEERKNRIAFLSKSIDALKKDEENTSLSEEYNQYLRLRNELNELKIKLAALECIENNTALNDNLSQIATLEHNLKKWKSNSYVIALDDELKKSQQLKSLTHFYETNEPKLLGEIDRVAAIYTKLEEQQSKSVFNSTQRSDQIMKLQAEKLKFAQTFSNLISTREDNLAKNAAQYYTRERQQDLIRQLEERGNALETQVNNKEAQMRDINRKIEQKKVDIEDMHYYCTDLRNSLDHSQNVMNELQRILKEKTKLLDEENQLGNQVEENHRKMQKKWESISQGNNPAKDQLEKECDDLMAMIKCSTCRTRFRTHILIRCMHTFCKPCIEARLETRQRRCPTCSESFGASDVRLFHL